MSADFIDSNVFVYLFDDADLAKQAAASHLITNAIREGTGVISYQVVQETLNVLTRKLRVPLTEGDSVRFLEDVLAPLWRVVPTMHLYRTALSVRARYRFSFYDALIVAAALESGSRRLYSEDLQHDQIVEDLRIVNPFAAIP